MRKMFALCVMNILWLSQIHGMVSVDGLTGQERLAPAHTQSSMVIKPLDESHINREQEKFTKSLTRKTWLRNGLTLSATATAAGLLYWWSKSDLGLAGKVQEQSHADWFKTLPEDKQENILKFIFDKVHEADALSIKSLARKIVPYALSTAASGLISNSLHMILIQPFSKVINKLYHPLELEWFLETQSNVPELFEALQAHIAVLEINRDRYHKELYAQTVNDLTFQTERVLAFMRYQLVALHIPQKSLRLKAVQAANRLKDTCETWTRMCQEAFSAPEQPTVHLENTVNFFKTEFNAAIKQFVAVEALCD